MSTRIIAILTILCSLNIFGYVEPCTDVSISSLIKDVISQNEQSLIFFLQKYFEEGKIFIPILLVLLAGFLTSLSPCVYPLIPITITLLGSKTYKNRTQGFLTALVYVLGMSLTYASLGIIFASFGILFGSFMQSSIATLIIALFLLWMSLFMWEVINFSLPANLTNKLTKITSKGFRGAFLMGLGAGFIAAPCTGPVLGFILALLAQGQSISFAVILMLFFSLGLGILFLVLGTFSSSLALLPKSGPWMSFVKGMFGSIILAASFYYFSLVFFKFDKFLFTIKNLGLIFVIILTILTLLSSVIFSLKYRYKYFLYVNYIVLAVLLVTIFRWQSLYDAKSFENNTITWNIINNKNNSSKDFEHYLEEAKKACKPVLLDFYADWCVACRELEHTFSNKSVSEVLEKFYLIRIDSTNSSKLINHLQKKFSVTGLPTLVILSPNIFEVKEKIVGFIRPTEFLQILAQIK